MPKANGQVVVIRDLRDGWEFTIDGMKIEGITAVWFECAVSEVSRVGLEFFPGSMEIESDRVLGTHYPRLWPGTRVFWRDLRSWVRYRWRFGWGNTLERMLKELGRPVDSD